MATTTVTAVLDQEHALAASEALIERLKEDAEHLLPHLERVVTDGLHARLAHQDAQTTARELGRTLAALQEIGWPHELTRPNRLRELRKAAGWSVEQLADRAAVSKSDLYRWELGHTIPDWLAEDFARLFGVTVTYLLCEEAA